MSIVLKNSRDLIDPDNFKLKLLVYSMPGGGKTAFTATAAQVGKLGVAACETGHGKGQLTTAWAGYDYCEPSTYNEFEAVCDGLVFKDAYDIVGLDSLSYMVKTFIKDHALSMPRKKGDTPQRRAGVPEISDYGVMGELTRGLLNRLLNQKKHLIVTATLRIEKPDAETGKGEFLIEPDLPGQLALGSTAMFDAVLCLRSRTRLRDRKDAKSKYTERYILTEKTGAVIAKTRLVGPDGKSILPPEIPFNLETGEGTFPWILNHCLETYKKIREKAA